MKFIIDRTKNLKWDKKYVLYSTIVASAINFIVGVFGIKFFGKNIIGQFQASRSAVQLIAALQPSFTFSFLLTMSDPKTDFEQELDDVKKSNYSALIWAAILVIFSAFFLKTDNMFAYLFLMVSFYFSGVSGIYARGLLRSDKLMQAAISEAAISLLSTVFLFMSRFDLFVWMFGIRFFVKAWIQYPYKYWGLSFPTKDFIKRRNKLGMPFLIRGFIQTFIQYGDKAMVGFAFTAGVVAYYSLGSAFAIAFIVISSSGTTYYLSILNSEGLKKHVLRDSYQLLGLIVLVLPVMELFLNYSYKTYDRTDVLAGYINLSLVSLISLFSLVYGAANIWKSNLLNVSIIVAQIVFVLLNKLFGLPIIYLFYIMICPLLVICVTEKEWKSVLIFSFLAGFYLFWQKVALPNPVLIGLSVVAIPLSAYLFYKLFFKKNSHA